MAKYDVHFSCGHTEVKELFGPSLDRQSKITYWERYGVCTQCYYEQRDIENSIGCDEVEMSYRDYKERFADCKTKMGSYDGKTKTIVVFVPRQS